MVDFGPVFWRQEFNEYLLLHGGADGFTVQRIVSSCGCTLIDGADSLVGRAVPAEDVLPLSVSFSTGDVPGPKMAAIQVAGSDGRMHTAEIRAQVLGTWDVSPTKVELPNPWAEGAPKSAIVTVSSADERMGIHAQATADWLTCDVERGLEGAEIVLRADAQRVLSGKCSTWLAISTSDPTVNQRLVKSQCRRTS